MKTELKCKCGSSAVFNDDRGKYINPGGHPDDKGRTYRIEVWADEWLDRHSGCLKEIDCLQLMQKLEIKDGDVIVLKCKQKITNEAAKHMRESYQTAMEGFSIKDIKVLILEEGIDIGVITKGVKEKANG